MTDIKVADVEVTADIAGVDLHPIHVEVNRKIGPSAGEAIIEGYVEDTSSIEMDQSVDISMSTEIGAGDEITNRLFRGKVKKATQSEKGVVTIEAYDELVELHGKTVRYTNEEPLEAWSVLTDVLFDAGYVPAINYDNVFEGGLPPNKQPHIPDPDTEVLGEPTVGKHAYGSGRRGEPLSRVLADLARKLGCMMWADKNNVINIVPYPEHGRYEARYITEVNSGDGTVNKTKTLVQGGTPTSSIGSGAAFSYDQDRIQSDAENEDSEDEREFQYSDDNVITQEEANRVATSNQFNINMSKNVGEITVVGNPAPELFDVVTVPQLRNAATQNVDDSWVRGTLATIDDAEYSITGIHHVADAENGYTTTLELGPDPNGASDTISGIADAIANELTDRIDGQKEDNGVLDFIPGFE